MSLRRLNHARKLWAPALLVLWLLAWSVAIAQPCVVQTAAGHGQAAHGEHATSHRHGTAGHDHQGCGHALDHSDDSLLVKQADNSRSASPVFLAAAFVLVLPDTQAGGHRPPDLHPSPPPRLPVYLNTARLRI